MAHARQEPAYIPEALARRVLERAARLDAERRGGVSTFDLRLAASEAGISDESLDRALSEVTGLPAVPAAEPARARRARRPLQALLVASAAVVAALLVAGGLRLGAPAEEVVIRPVQEIRVEVAPAPDPAGTQRR